MCVCRKVDITIDAGIVNRPSKVLVQESVLESDAHTAGLAGMKAGEQFPYMKE